ncbi:uncharacterized protein PGTG_22450 [Puccinia graminis f. sp. tritici CRL 75-36-700-3]|uniref:Uncharacterized protein n=2 Tax=Puccinia graminis f. sp. tritici TaxID=56615 RepID=H6QUH2_PUCGT|nr:uncharacterized protein PGTG_22450 [Puccinia graminis f. sp. tritici CRL 75-36-700-3]EHS64634.1 hypothetical protein PGTG_22450 [Puccinia graminis f. sp. tritici CRL 75-36-700-3]
MDEDVIISDGNLAHDSRLVIIPPSSLHTLLNRILGNPANQNVSGAVLVDPNFVDTILNLLATNKHNVR